MLRCNASSPYDQAWRAKSVGQDIAAGEGVGDSTCLLMACTPRLRQIPFRSDVDCLSAGQRMWRMYCAWQRVSARSGPTCVSGISQEALGIRETRSWPRRLREQQHQEFEFIHNSSTL